MLLLTSENLLVRVVDAARWTVERFEEIFNFPFAQFIFCDGGRGSLLPENGVETPFSAGAAVFVAKGARCGVIAEDGPLKFRKIACDTAMTPYLMNYFDGGNVNLLEKCSTELKRLYGELYGLCGSAAVSKDKNVSLKLYRALILMGQEIAGKNDNEAGVLREMADRYGDYIFKSFKAGEEAAPAPEAEALMRRVYGMSVGEYSLYIRLERSKPFICFMRKDIDFDWLAEYLGFGGAGEFRESFVRRFGLTVEEYAAKMV